VNPYLPEGSATPLPSFGEERVAVVAPTATAAAKEFSKSATSFKSDTLILC
jgi:hypothetical protein